MKFARDVRGSTLHLDMVSLGRGQGPKAEEFINKAQILKGNELSLHCVTFSNSKSQFGYEWLVMERRQIYI